MADEMLNPYPGPRPFQPEEYRIFAGRDNEVCDLASLIISHPVVLLYAQSGAGKTSLLNAGLIPELQEKDVELLPVNRVTIPVAETVPLNHTRNAFMFNVISNLLPSLPDHDSWLQTATLADVLIRIPRSTDQFGEQRHRLIVFDQFEELFSHYPQRWQDRTNFFRQVEEALQKDSFLRVLFILREDYLAAFGEFANILPEGVRTRYRLERLRGLEALLAITRPLEGTPWSYADGVAETLVSDLMAIAVESPSGKAVTVPGEFVEPVQLQVVCYTLFERVRQLERELRGSTLITTNDLQAFGNVDDALKGFYERVLTMAATQSGVREEALRTWFDRKLITAAGTRGTVFRGREDTEGIPNAAIDILEKQHLIRPELRAGAHWFELTHDRFIGPIRKSNQEWLSTRSRKKTRYLHWMIVAISLVTVLGTGIIAWQRHKLVIEQEKLEIVRKQNNEALGLIFSGIEYAKRGEVRKAVDAYAKAQNIDPELQIPAGIWNELCWFGSLWGHGADVMYACEQAVALRPKDGIIRDSRGFARALTGDLKGAIEDFQAFIDEAEDWPLEKTDWKTEKLRRRRWIDQLRAGKNPVTPDELREIRRIKGIEKDS
jgi:tetratricopeptide (TPR) repeat protein